MKISKNNKKLVLGILIGTIISGTIVYAATITASNIAYNNSQSGLQATNTQAAIDELKAKANNTWCKDGFEKKNETSSGYECKVPVLAWQPTYFAFGTPTTSDTTPPSGKNVFAAMDTDGNKGVCINRGGERHCFQTNNVEFEQQHVQEVFSDISCSVYSSSVRCNASFIRTAASFMWFMEMPFFCLSWFPGFHPSSPSFPVLCLSCHTSFYQIPGTVNVQNILFTAVSFLFSRESIFD